MKRAILPLILAAACMLAFLLMGQAPSPHGAMELHSPGGGITQGDADARYLMLDASNDPLTGSLEVASYIDVQGLMSSWVDAAETTNYATARAYNWTTGVDGIAALNAYPSSYGGPGNCSATADAPRSAELWLKSAGTGGTSRVCGDTTAPIAIGTAAGGLGTNWIEVARFGASGLVVNDTGAAAVDFRVEGDTDAALLVVDASADAVGIGTATPTATLDIVAGTLATTSSALRATSTLTAPAGSFQGGAWVTTAATGTTNAYQTSLYSALTGSAGAAVTAGVYVENIATGTGTSPMTIIGSPQLQANWGLFFNAASTSTGHNVGAGGYAARSSSRNIGLLGMASATTTAGAATDAIGVYGKAAQHTAGSMGARVGGMFTLYPTDAIGTLTDAALLADNATTTAPILLGRDNGSAVFSVLDGAGVAVFGPTEFAFNDAAAAIDFRVEGDTDAALLVIDASADAVGVGTATPTAGTLTAALPVVITQGTAVAPSVRFGGDADTGIYQGAGTGALYVAADGVQAASISGAGGHRFYATDGTTHRLALLSTGNFSYQDLLPSATDLLRLGSMTAQWLQAVFDGGSVTAPPIVLGDADTGIYSTAAGSVDITCNGTLCGTFSADGETYLALGAAGSDAKPSIHSRSDTDTGFTWTGSANTAAIVGGGVRQFTVDATSARLPHVSSGTPTLFQLPAIVSTTAALPTCNDANEGSLSYFDDTDDGNDALICWCQANAARTVFTWMYVPTGTPC